MTPEELHRFDSARALIATGWSQANAAIQCGFTKPTLCRLLKEYKATGTVLAKYPLGPRDSVELTKADGEALRGAMLRFESRRRVAEYVVLARTVSEPVAEALRVIIAKAAELRRPPQWPAWMQRACILTQEERAAFRGAKHLMDVEPIRPKGRFYEHCDELGNVTLKPLYPGALWQSDDESENTPSVSIDPVTGETQVNRQTLKTIDVDSGYWLGNTAISRAKDAYTLEDQADMALELVDAHGMPLAWAIERGPWDNSFWWGIKLPKAWWETPQCPQYRFGGIDVSAGGPIAMQECFKSRHKAIVEGGFHHLQTLDAHSSLDIGRTRGEFEKAAKLLTAAHDGQARGVNAFPELAQRADMTAQALMRRNAELQLRQMHGSQMVRPVELWAQKQTRSLSQADRWRFLPVKKTDTSRGQMIDVKVDRPEHKDRRFLFCTEGMECAWDWHRHLPQSWRLFIAFHPHRPDLGCQVFNACHPDSALNPGRYPLGLYLGTAPAVSLAPQFRIGPGRSHSGDFEGRKSWARHVARESRILVNAGGTNTKIVRSSFYAQDGELAMSRMGAPDPHAQRQGDLEATRQPARLPLSESPSPRVAKSPSLPVPDLTDRRATLDELEAEYAEEMAWR